MSKVSVHIVTFNSLPYLESMFRSLEHQAFRDFSVLVIDNASKDGTVEWIERYVEEHTPPFGHPSREGTSIDSPPWRGGREADGVGFNMRMVKNRENAGFARAHNQAIHFTDSEYVLTLNPDVILHERFLERLVQAMVANPRAGSASGKILRAAGTPDELSERTFTKTIDSAGIIADRKRFFRDRGAGEEDRGQYDQSGQVGRISRTGRIGSDSVIGPSGAAAMYRREALVDAALKTQNSPPQYFDELYHSYKEDVDLAWRLQRRGWACVFVPGARAYHFRTLKASGEGIGKIAREYRARAPRLAFLSYRNHWYTLVKNEAGERMWKDLPWIAGWEFAKMVFLLFTRPGVVFRAWKDIIVNWRRLMERRNQIQNSKSKTQNHGVPHGST